MTELTIVFFFDYHPLVFKWTHFIQLYILDSLNIFWYNKFFEATAFWKTKVLLTKDFPEIKKEKKGRFSKVQHT